jgi:hypothetical protein
VSPLALALGLALTLGLGARGQRAGHPPRFNELLRARALRGSQKRSCQTSRSGSEAELCPERRAAERDSKGMGGLKGYQVSGSKRAGRALDRHGRRESEEWVEKGCQCWCGRKAIGKTGWMRKDWRGRDGTSGCQSSNASLRLFRVSGSGWGFGRWPSGWRIINCPA